MSKPKVEVYGLSDIRINGQHAGCVVDVILNHGSGPLKTRAAMARAAETGEPPPPDIGSDIQKGLEEWEAGVHAFHNERHKTLITEHGTALETQAIELSKGHEKDLTELSRNHAKKLESKVAEMQTKINELAERDANHGQHVAKLTNSHREKLKEQASRYVSELEAKDAIIRELEAMIELMSGPNGTEVGKQLKLEKEIAEAERVRAEADARLARLTAVAATMRGGSK